MVYFSEVENRSTKPFTAFYNARKNGKLPLHSYTIATRNRPLCYICAEVIIMCLRCFLTSKKSGPNVKEEPPASPLAREECFRSISRPTQRCSHRADLALAYIITQKTNTTGVRTYSERSCQLHLSLSFTCFSQTTMTGGRFHCFCFNFLIYPR